MICLLHNGESLTNVLIVLLQKCHAKKVIVQHNVPYMLAPSFRTPHLLFFFLQFPLTLVTRTYFKENHRSHISFTVSIVQFHTLHPKYKYKSFFLLLLVKCFQFQGTSDFNCGEWKCLCRKLMQTLQNSKAKPDSGLGRCSVCLKALLPSLLT